MRNWKPTTISGQYEVSDKGEVRSLTKRAKTLKPNVSSHGYPRVSLYLDGWRSPPKTVYVHRLVAAAFLGESSLEVNHIDGCKTNNDLANLEYVTSAENTRHAARTGLIASGERSGTSKLTAAEVEDIRDRWTDGETQKSIAAHYGVTQSNVCRIVNGETWGRAVA